MPRSRLSKGSLPVAMMALALVGCPDPEATFNDFVERTEDARALLGDGIESEVIHRDNLALLPGDPAASTG